METGERVPRARGEAKRVEIVEAAERVFLEQGYAGASMDRVATEAGASKRTVYNHFAGKDELFRAVLERMYGRSLNSPTGMPAHGTDLPTALEIMGWRVLSHIADPKVQAMIRLVMTEAPRNPEIARVYTTSGKDPSIQRFAGWLEEEARAGRLVVENPVIAAEQFIGCLKETVVWPALLGLEPAFSRELVIREAVTTFLARYAPKEGK